MKTNPLITAFLCFGLWQSAHAATKYWDIDGATPGAGGDAPAGTWNTGGSANWTTSSAGATTATTWADADDAVFSAGSDATNIFTVTLDNTASPPVQNAGNLTVQEGVLTLAADPGVFLNIGGGVAGKGIVNIGDGLNATITADFDSAYGTFGDNNGQFTKTGTGTLTLSGVNLHGGTNVVVQGVLVAANNDALGGSGAPTVVSNGAALHLSGTRAMAEPAILNGGGVANTGALRGSSAASSWNGGVRLASDARIEAAGGQLNFNNYSVEGTNGGSSFNLTVGGSGGRVRFNNAVIAPQDVPVNLGTGTLTKEGTTLLQLENTNTCSAFYFNGGDIYPRNDAGWAGFGQGPIFVGAGAGNIRASNQDVYWGYYGGYNVSLAAGANLGFDAFVSWTLWVDCTFTGAGGIAKRGTGYAVLTNYHSTYTGATTIERGTLILAANSSISNTTAIDVWTNGIFDVSALSGGFVLQTAQTFKGNGTILGNVTAKGAISPGASIGSLTNEGNLTLGGSLLIEVDKSLAPNSSNDMITVSGTLSHSGGGTLTVANLGPALAVNDSFKVFNKAVSGGQTISVTGAGAVWTNRLNFDGSIAVLSLSPTVPATNLTIAAVGPTSVGLRGLGLANSAYSVYASTNVALSMSNWWKIGATNSNGGGVIQYLDTQATNTQRFYRFGQP